MIIDRKPTPAELSSFRQALEKERIRLQWTKDFLRTMISVIIGGKLTTATTLNEWGRLHRDLAHRKPLPQQDAKTGAGSQGTPMKPARVTSPTKIIQAWYRELAKMKHPDKGGTTEDMQKLNDEYEQLKGGSL